jgi:hypothetical protein
MTKPELTNKRSLGFSKWARENLRDSKTGLVWTDIDGYFMDYNKHLIMIVECKTKNALMSYPQRQQLLQLDTILKAGTKPPFEYWGFYLITMDGDSPENSTWIRINGIPTGLQTLKKLLNFEEKFNPAQLFKQQYFDARNNMSPVKIQSQTMTQDTR